MRQVSFGFSDDYFIGQIRGQSPRYGVVAVEFNWMQNHKKVV
jgi:hypothetical protein